MRRFFAPEMAEFIKQNCVALATSSGLNDIDVVTAGGTILARPFQNGKGPHWKAFGLSDLQSKGLVFDRLPEAERKPKKLEPSEFFDGLASLAPVPPGTLICRQYTRAFERDDKGELRRHENQRTISGPNGDFLWLTEAEWKSLVPANPTKGLKYPVPAAIARRIFIDHFLINGSETIGTAWPAEQVRSGELTLTVEEASAASVRLHLKGLVRFADNADFAKATRKAEFSLVGLLNYDAKKKVFDRFDIAALGDYAPFTGLSTSTTVGIAFELVAPDSRDYGIPPGTHYSK